MEKVNDVDEADLWDESLEEGSGFLAVSWLLSTIGVFFLLYLYSPFFFSGPDSRPEMTVGVGLMFALAFGVIFGGIGLGWFYSKKTPWKSLDKTFQVLLTIFSGLMVILVVSGLISVLS